MQQYWVGKRVRLRAVEPGDAAAHHRFNQSVDYGLLDQIYPPQAAGRVEEWAERKGKAGFDDETYSFQIVALESDELAGHIATHHADHRVGTFAYGLNVLDGFRGKGYAQEAICLVLRYYFQELRYQKVNVDVMAGNAASTRLHERMGFVAEGRRRRSAYTCGELTDVLLYGMTAEEFRELYPEYWRTLESQNG
jgi:RimJ/RimL family protein N-acetyltransferase